MLNRLRRFPPLRFLITGGTAFIALWALAEPLVEFGVVKLESLGLKGYIVLALLSGVIALSFEFVRTRLHPVTVCQFNRVMAYLPLYIAQRHGFFAKEGLRVTIIDGNGDEPTWRAVASGDAEFGISDPVGMIRDDLTAGVVIATVLGKLPMWGVSRKSMTPIRSMDRFKNKRTSVFNEPTTQYALLKKALLDAKVSVNDHLVGHSPGSEMSGLLDDDIDIVLMLEPQATIAERAGAFRVFSAAKVVGPFLCTGCFTSKKFARLHPAAVQSFVNAMERATRLLHKDHLSVLKVVHEEFADIDRTKAELACIRMIDEGVFPTSVVVDPVAWQTAVKVWFPDNWQEYDFKDFVDNKFALKARQMK